MPSTIAIVEDNNVVRGCLVELVNSIPGCECVANFSNGEDAIKAIPDLAPDLVMMDIHLPNLSGIECAARLKEALPALAILMLTVYEDEEKIFQVFKAGASGYILKRSSPREVVRAVEDMLDGGVCALTCAASAAEPAVKTAAHKSLRTMSWGDKLKEAGVVGVVQLGMSAFGTIFIFERLFGLRRKNLVPPGLTARAKKLWSEGKFDELEKLGATKPNT